MRSLSHIETSKSGERERGSASETEKAALCPRISNWLVEGGRFRTEICLDPISAFMAVTGKELPDAQS